MASYAILFMHDTAPSFRVVRGVTEAEAQVARDRVAAIYDDDGARAVLLFDSENDLDQINADYDELTAELSR